MLALAHRASYIVPMLATPLTPTVPRWCLKSHEAVMVVWSAVGTRNSLTEVDDDR